MESPDRTRGDAILDSVKATFAAKGFDGASMQDLARDAGMSAGNFYRYFPSKSALIEALVEREIDCVRVIFDAVIGAGDPLAAFRALVRDRLSEAYADHDQIWVEIEAAAIRRPEFRTLIERMEAELVRNLLAVFARIAGLDEAEAGARFSGEARLLLVLVQSVHIGCGARAADPQFAAVVLRTIDQTLAGIAATRRPELHSLRS